MQSKTFTAVLAVITILVCTLAGIQLAQDDLRTVFGAPARPMGEELYVFDPKAIHTATISNFTGEAVEFKKQNGAWIMYQVGALYDRADFRDLQRIVYFSRHLRIEDVVRRKDTSLEVTGMHETATHPGHFRLTLTDHRGNRVADYRLGRRTALHRIEEKSGQFAETFFVHPGEKGQKDYIYVCSAPGTLKPSVRQILDRGFERLRDHRPFLFDPATLADVTIRQRGSELVLSREGKSKPWRMTKPLESRTKPDTMAGLLKGLYELEAIKVHNRGSVTIPPRPPEGYYLEVELRHFGADGKRQQGSVSLTIDPPATEDADTVYAIMDNRPAVVLELPFEPAKGRIAIKQLPLAVDQLRARTLVSLDIRALRTIAIHHLNLPDPIQIFLGREHHSGNRRWMLHMNGDVAPANEIALGKLLHAVTRDEVVGYASDAARNLGAFGLSPPHKRLVLRGGKEEVVDLFFGRGSNGNFYAMRRGSSTVAEIGAGTFSAVASRPFDWRDTLLMPFSIVDLSVMKIEPPARPPLANPELILNYTFLDETWKARQYGENVTTHLNPQRANQYLKFIEGLRVDKWLGDTSPVAERALRNPSFRFTAIFREMNDDGDRVGTRELSFELAPASPSAANRYFYGQLSGDPHYFLLGVDAYRQLTTRLVDGE